jgi:glycosyltransferase involved in cell wall biosynthesis
VKVLEVAALEGTLYTLLRPLIRRLRREGFEVHGACARGKSLQFDLQIPVHPIPFSRHPLTLRHLSALFALIGLMRRERFDVVHVHTPIAAVLGRIAAWIARVPHVVYTAHGFAFHDGTPRRLRRAMIVLERFLCRRMTDVLFLQSREDLEMADALRIRARREGAIWIGNGVSVDRFRPGRDDSVRAEFGFDPEDPVVIFVGRLIREKGLPELLEALVLVRREFPRVRLLVVGATMMGPGNADGVEVARRWAGRLKIEAAVRFTGLRNDVERLLRAADLLVLPSHREGMPRSILEAMATGIPVVATDIRGCREEVVHGETGLLVPVGDPVRLAGAIVEILRDPVKREAMGVAGRRRALELFDEEKVLDRQVEVFQRLL